MKTLFAAVEIPSALAQRVSAAGMDCAALMSCRGSLEDAEETLALAREHGVSWVVADGYAFGPEWQRRVRDGGVKLAMLDDYAHHSEYLADLVVNPNAGASQCWYKSLQPTTQLLAGGAFALLRREFTACEPLKSQTHSRVHNVLVTLGGADPHNVSTTVVAALHRLSAVEATVVVGAANRHRAELDRAAGAGPASIKLITDATEMSALMAKADLAISGAGSTAWELAFMGVPALLVVLADNQERIAAEMARAGAATNLGDYRHLTVDAVARAIKELIEDAARREAMAQAGPALIDGHGGARVAAALAGASRITIVSDATSWLNPYLVPFRAELAAANHVVRWVHDIKEIGRGEIALLLSLTQIVPSALLRRHASNVVVHESAVPRGRGWSPLTWQVLEGANEIPISLLEATTSVDAGPVYAQAVIKLRGTELVDELRDAQAAATIRLCRQYIARFPFSLSDARPQDGSPSYYPRRRPEDSRLDPDRTLRDQFNLLRVADPKRYPAFFEIGGRRYHVAISAAPQLPDSAAAVATLESASSRPTVLLTAAGGIALPGLIAHLQKSGMRVIAVDMNATARGLTLADRGYTVPAATTAEFLPALRQICERERVDIIIPLVDEELLPVQSLASPSLHVLTPRQQFIETCLDKYALARRLKAAGIPAPRSWLATDDLSDVVFPAIVKPRTGRGSRGVSVVQSADQLEAILRPLGSRRDEMMVQDFVDGTEFTISVVVWRDGEVQAVVPKEIIVKRGVTQMAVTRRQPAIDRLCRRLQETLRADGPFNVQLRLDPASGEPLLFEINPRYSTTVTHTIAAGIDEVYGLCLQALRGRDAHRFGEWQENLVLRRRSVDEFAPESEVLREQASHVCRNAP